METISVAITGSSDMHCIELDLQNLERQRDAEMLCSRWHFIVCLLLLRI